MYTQAAAGAAVVLRYEDCVGEEDQRNMASKSVSANLAHTGRSEVRPRQRVKDVKTSRTWKYNDDRETRQQLASMILMD